MILTEDIARQHDHAAFARKVVFPSQRGFAATVGLILLDILAFF